MILFTLLLSSMVTLQQESEEPQVYRFGVENRTVYVDVFVNRGGKPVKGLTSESFVVRDNGVRQQAQLLNQGDLPLTSVLLMDTSDSVAGEELNHLQAAAHAYMEVLGPEDEAGLMTFTHRMRLRKGLGYNLTELHRLVDESLESGETSLHDALFSCVKLVEARAGRPLVLTFSDGLDRTSWLTQGEVIEKLQTSEAVVYAVGVKRPPIPSLRLSGRRMCGVAELPPGDFLRSIAAQTGGRVWFLDSSTNLKEIFLSVLNEMRNRYLVCYQPHGVPVDGWHTLEVEVKGFESSEIRARPGYRVRSKK